MTENVEQPAGGAPKRDIVAEFRKNPAAEKILAAAALGVLIAFIVHGQWSSLFAFKYQWFPTLAFLGSILVLVLVGLDLFGLKVMYAKLRVRVLIVLAVLPALGFVIDMLKTFWPAVMLAGSIVMAFAAAKISTREKIIGGS